MPIPFTQRVLKALGSIYKPVGGQTGPGELDLASPITVVHDVSRESEIGSGINSQLGYFVIPTINVHGAGGILFDIVDPWAIVDTAGIPRSQVGVWLIDLFASTNTDLSIDQIVSSVLFPTIPGAFAGEALPLRAWDGGEFQSTDAGGTIRPAKVDPDSPVPRLPIYMPDGAVVNIATDALLAATISCHMMFWSGAHGTLPPGLA